MSASMKDLTDMRFGRLICLQPVGRDPLTRCVMWLCQCDCGSQTTVRSQRLLIGNTRSCGCLHRDQRIEQCKSRATHGATRSSLHSRWTNGTMKAVGGKKFSSDMGGGGTTFVGHSGYTKADGTSSLKATRNKRSVWTVTTKPYKGAHFATFPPDLIRPCILAGCPPGGVVFDPFMGSGTVAQVAIETGRNWLDVELKPEYIELAWKRIREAAGQSAFPIEVA